MVSFVDVFVGLANDPDKQDARRAAKVLEKNGVDSIEKLLATDDMTIANMKGIGPRSLAVISRIKTEESAKAEKKAEEYKKLKGESCVKNFKYYFMKAGCGYLEACRIEHVVKKHCCKEPSDLLKFKPMEIGSWKFIGPKRLDKIIAARQFIMDDKQ